MDRIRKLWSFVSSFLDLSIPFHVKSSSHLEDATAVSLGRCLAAPVLHRRNSEHHCSRAWDSHMANPRQSQPQNHLSTLQAPAFNIKGYFSSSFICLLAHAQVSLATPSDRPHLERRQIRHIPQGRSVAADDKRGINAGDGSNQDVCADLVNSTFPSFLHSSRNKNQYPATWMVLHYKLEVTTLVPELTVSCAHAHKCTSLSLCLPRKELKALLDASRTTIRR